MLSITEVQPSRGSSGVDRQLVEWRGKLTQGRSFPEETLGFCFASSTTSHYRWQAMERGRGRGRGGDGGGYLTRDQEADIDMASTVQDCDVAPGRYISAAINTSSQIQI